MSVPNIMDNEERLAYCRRFSSASATRCSIVWSLRASTSLLSETSVNPPTHPRFFPFSLKGRILPEKDQVSASELEVAGFGETYSNWVQLPFFQRNSMLLTPGASGWVNISFHATSVCCTSSGKTLSRHLDSGAFAG